MKKVLSFCLALIMSVSLLPAAALAENAEPAQLYRDNGQTALSQPLGGEMTLYLSTLSTSDEDRVNSRITRSEYDISTTGSVGSVSWATLEGIDAVCWNTNGAVVGATGQIVATHKTSGASYAIDTHVGAPYLGVYDGNPEQEPTVRMLDESNDEYVVEYTTAPVNVYIYLGVESCVLSEGTIDQSIQDKVAVTKINDRLLQVTLKQAVEGSFKANVKFTITEDSDIENQACVIAFTNSLSPAAGIYLSENNGMPDGECIPARDNGGVISFGELPYDSSKDKIFYYYNAEATALSLNNKPDGVYSYIENIGGGNHFWKITVRAPRAEYGGFSINLDYGQGNIPVSFEDTYMPAYQRGLYYKPLRGVDSGNPYVDEEDPYYTGSVTLSPYVDRCDIATYYCDGQNFSPVEVGFSDTLAVDVVTFAERPGWYVFAAYDYGDGEMFFDDDNTQTIHTLPVRTRIPDYAFYAEDTVSEETYRMYTLAAENTSMNEAYKDYRYVKDLYFLPKDAGYDLSTKELVVEVMQRQYLPNGNETDSIEYPVSEYAYTLDMAPDGKSILATVFTNDSDVLFKLGIYEKTDSGDRGEHLYGNYVNILAPDDTDTLVFHINDQGDYAAAKFLPKHIFDELKELGRDVTLEQENFPGGATLDKDIVGEIAGTDKAVNFCMTAGAASEEEEELIAAALDSGETTIDVLEFKLYFGKEEKHELGGKATIKYIADLPKGTDVKVYYLNDAGELEEMDATYQNGNIIFSSNHYSKFVLTATAEVTTPNKPNRPNRPHRPAKPAEPAGPEVPVVPTMPVFDDVAEDYWAKEAIAWAAEQGYVTGTGAGEYLPENNVSRQQIWMMLSRISGENAESMAAAKAWAMANGISDGTNPGTAVTRQQLVTLLYRYAILMGYDVSVGEDTNILSYDDVFSVSEYAIPAFQWACGAGVVNGTTERMLSPLGTATRAQFAVMLQRFCEKVVK